MNAKANAIGTKMRKLDLNSSIIRVFLAFRDAADGNRFACAGMPLLL
jgi:hypothetical protein